MITLLGAGGPIANELAQILATRNQPFRLVGRTPRPLPGAEICAADLSDPEQAIRAVAGSQVVHLLAGLKYDIGIWRDLWPRIMVNTIEACKRAQAKLIFFDNVYMYGKVSGPMTEQTPYAPSSKKGEVRARIATTLMDEVKAGHLTAMIARCADYYGPSTEHSAPHVLVLRPLATGSKPSCLVRDDMPHSLTFTRDAARALDTLSERDSAWNQVWHLPTTSNPPTGKEFIAMAAQELSAPAKYRVLNRAMIRVFGLFNSDIRELYEMLYQYDSPYIFDSTKFANEFRVAGTPYAEGMRIAAASYKR